MDGTYTLTITVKSRLDELKAADQAFRDDPNEETAARLKEILSGPLFLMETEASRRLCDASGKA